MRALSAIATTSTRIEYTLDKRLYPGCHPNYV
jgi:hypothetical protein